MTPITSNREIERLERLLAESREECRRLEDKRIKEMLDHQHLKVEHDQVEMVMNEYFDEIRRLREALEYYANPALYIAQITTYNTGDYDLDCELLYEGGKNARAALEAAQAKAREPGEGRE